MNDETLHRTYAVPERNLSYGEIKERETMADRTKKRKKELREYEKLELNEERFKYYNIKDPQ